MGDKWQHVIADPQQRDIPIDDENTKSEHIDETTILWEIITNSVRGSYPGGVWLGGRKYTLTRQQELEVEGKPVTVIFGARSKGGVCICCTEQSVVVGFNDELKSQTGGNCQKAVMRFVEYLFQNE